MVEATAAAMLSVRDDGQPELRPFPDPSDRLVLGRRQEVKDDPIGRQGFPVSGRGEHA